MCNKKIKSFGVRKTLGLLLALSLRSNLTLSNLLDFSKVQVSQQLNRHDTSHFSRLL